MSDFDAEAERERLREKYESEAESRERTQQMSELLLKGATMTNRHCGECGSPIFRYDDQEFCPNCQRATEGAGGDDAASDAPVSPGGDAGGSNEADPAGTGDAASGAGTDGSSDPTAAGDAPRSGAGTPAVDAATNADPAATRANADPTTAGANRRASNTDAATSNGAGAAEPEPDRGAERAVADAPVERDRGAAGGATAGDDGATPTRHAARESLLGALTRHAGLATETDEPRRATEHLKAARSAAAALAELDGD